MQFPPTDFESEDFIKDLRRASQSQNEYASKKMTTNRELISITKPDNLRAINDDEVEIIPFDGGKLEWLGSGNIPLTSFQTSALLPRRRNHSQTIQSITDTLKILRRI